VGAAVGVSRAHDSRAGRPLVTCVVPTFDAERNLEGALACLLAQSHRPIEIVVADDGSSDRTVELARAAGPPVRVVTQSTAGPAATRNLGIRSATGPFVAFLDPDDRWLPEKLERQLARFAARPELDCSVTGVRIVWDDPDDPAARELAFHPRAGVVPGYATPTLLARRSAFDRVGLLDESRWFSDATEWFTRALDAGLVVELLPEPLVERHVHAGNLSRRRAAESADEFLDLLRARIAARRAR
jgi:glycosyltransferase involved in cell wall biosynthesis